MMISPSSPQQANPLFHWLASNPACLYDLGLPATILVNSRATQFLDSLGQPIEAFFIPIPLPITLVSPANAQTSSGDPVLDLTLIDLHISIYASTEFTPGQAGLHLTSSIKVPKGTDLLVNGAQLPPGLYKSHSYCDALTGDLLNPITGYYFHSDKDASASSFPLEISHAPILTHPNCSILTLLSSIVKAFHADCSALTTQTQLSFKALEDHLDCISQIHSQMDANPSDEHALSSILCAQAQDLEILTAQRDQLIAKVASWKLKIADTFGSKSKKQAATIEFYRSPTPGSLSSFSPSFFSASPSAVSAGALAIDVSPDTTASVARFSPANTKKSPSKALGFTTPKRNKKAPPALAKIDETDLSLSFTKSAEISKDTQDFPDFFSSSSPMKAKDWKKQLEPITLALDWAREQKTYVEQAIIEQDGQQSFSQQCNTFIHPILLHWEYLYTLNQRAHTELQEFLSRPNLPEAWKTTFEKKCHAITQIHKDADHQIFRHFINTFICPYQESFDRMDFPPQLKKYAYSHRADLVASMARTNNPRGLFVALHLLQRQIPPAALPNFAENIIVQELQKAIGSQNNLSAVVLDLYLRCSYSNHSLFQQKIQLGGKKCPSKVFPKATTLEEFQTQMIPWKDRLHFLLQRKEATWANIQEIWHFMKFIADQASACVEGYDGFIEKTAPIGTYHQQWGQYIEGIKELYPTSCEERIYASVDLVHLSLAQTALLHACALFVEADTGLLDLYLNSVDPRYDTKIQRAIDLVENLQALDSLESFQRLCLKAQEIPKFTQHFDWLENHAIARTRFPVPPSSCFGFRNPSLNAIVDKRAYQQPLTPKEYAFFYEVRDVYLDSYIKTLQAIACFNLFFEASVPSDLKNIMKDFTAFLKKEQSMQRCALYKELQYFSMWLDGEDCLLSDGLQSKLYPFVALERLHMPRAIKDFEAYMLALPGMQSVESRSFENEGYHPLEEEELSLKDGTATQGHPLDDSATAEKAASLQSFFDGTEFSPPPSLLFTEKAKVAQEASMEQPFVYEPTGGFHLGSKCKPTNLK